MTELDGPGGAVVALFDRYAALPEADPDRGCPVAASAVDSRATNSSVRDAAAEALAARDRLAARN